MTTDHKIVTYAGLHRKLSRIRKGKTVEVVDFVVILDEDIVDKMGGRVFLKSLKADKWVVPFKNHNPAGDIKFAKEIGTKLVQLPRIKPNKVDFPLSTSYIIEKIKKTT